MDRWSLEKKNADHVCDNTVIEKRQAEGHIKMALPDGGSWAKNSLTARVTTNLKPRFVVFHTNLLSSSKWMHELGEALSRSNSK